MPAHQSKSHVAIIGCGYVGSELARRLVANGHDVLGTTRSPERLPELQQLGIAAEQLDVSDADRMKSLLAGRQAVYLTVAAGRRDADYERVYLTAARNLAAAAASAGVIRMIYTSSTSVYGQDDGQWVTEDSPTEPDSENGRILVKTERVLLDAQLPRGVSVVRLAGIHGPGRELQRFAAAAAGSTRDDGHAYVNLVHRDDVAGALIALLPLQHHGVLNLCDDQPIVRRELYDRLIRSAGVAPITWTAPSDSAGCGKRVCNQRIKALLCCRLQHPNPWV
jgi:nucleoside-diphosphate-sugar epimerase